MSQGRRTRHVAPSLTVGVVTRNAADASNAGGGDDRLGRGGPEADGACRVSDPGGVNRAKGYVL